MKKILLLFVFATSVTAAFSQICNPSGNVIIYSNYDGGELNINIDQNIPNLKIGIVAYEAATINISGAFVGNVTQVVFAGYPSTNNNHCTGSIPSTTVNGVSSGIVNILAYPPVTLNNPNGYSSIICAYSCDNNTNQGGCNTVDQVEAYFLSIFGGNLFSHHTQYSCWLSAQTFAVSGGGNCCPTPTNAPNADFTWSNGGFSICAGDCVDLTDLSTNNPTSWNWNLPGASTTSSILQNPTNICYPNAGTFGISLTATNGIGSDNVSYNITVHPLPAVPTISQNLSTLQSSAATSYQWALNGTPIGGATNQTYTVSINGTYTVTVTDANGCTNTSTPFNFNSVDVLSYQDSDMIFFYPNPSSDFITLKTPEHLIGSSFILVDQLGRVVYSGLIQNNQFVIDVHQFNSGIYTLLIQLEDRVFAKKLIVKN